MNNEFYEHKKSDAVKWIIVFVLIAVLIAGVVASLAVSLSDKIDTPIPAEGNITICPAGAAPHLQ